LLDTQVNDGSWSEFDLPNANSISGGRPRNHLHSVALPLLVLSQWAVAAGSAQSSAASEMSLKLVGVSAAD
jgi:hypothetical protein